MHPERQKLTLTPRWGHHAPQNCTFRHFTGRFAWGQRNSRQKINQIKHLQVVLEVRMLRFPRKSKDLREAVKVMDE
jgi:hypothetical protein